MIGYFRGCWEPSGLLGASEGEGRAGEEWKRRGGGGEGRPRWEGLLRREERESSDVGGGESFAPKLKSTQ